MSRSVCMTANLARAGNIAKYRQRQNFTFPFNIVDYFHLLTLQIIYPIDFHFKMAIRVNHFRQFLGILPNIPLKHSIFPWPQAILGQLPIESI